MNKFKLLYEKPNKNICILIALAIMPILFVFGAIYKNFIWHDILFLILSLSIMYSYLIFMYFYLSCQINNLFKSLGEDNMEHIKNGKNHTSSL